MGDQKNHIDLVSMAVDAKIGRGVVFAGKNIILKPRVRLDDACIIADNVVIGQGAWVRLGAVVLQSVPPNAIMEGNPARVVGYVVTEGDLRTADSTMVDLRALSVEARPKRVSLDVGLSEIFLMRSVEDVRGSLCVGEVPKDLPFSPKRYFLVYNVPSSELRGAHAHRRCKQFLVCVHGSCQLMLDDGIRRCELTLDSPDIGVYMPEMVWGTQYRYSSDAVLLVFASHHYDSDDYIRDYQEYINELGLG